VPFPHDPDFVSRDGLLDQIHEKSSIPGSRIVLVGLGGVGLGQSSLGGPFKADFKIENLDSPSNTATESGSSRLTPGFSGSMQVIRPAARKVSATSPTVLRFPGARTVTLIYSNSSGIGYKMKRSETGFLSLIMSMMTSSFADRWQVESRLKRTASTMSRRGHRLSTFSRARMALSSSRAGTKQ
jgi:hypothetical protein